MSREDSGGQPGMLRGSPDILLNCGFSIFMTTITSLQTNDTLFVNKIKILAVNVSGAPLTITGSPESSLCRQSRSIEVFDAFLPRRGGGDTALIVIFYWACTIQNAEDEYL